MSFCVFCEPKNVSQSGNIEAWGRGINKIVNGFASANLPEPIFEELGNGLQVTMYKDLNKDLNKDLTENQLKILAEIQKNKEITQAELAKIVNINDKNIRINIKKLKDLELLERVGNTRTGYWKIKA